jgi:hypothetical protein
MQRWGCGWKRVATGAVAGLAALAVGAGPAGACGSLVAPNGSVQLVRTTTLAAYHDGVEHYVTSFSFAGTPTSFGSIVPLPAEPTTVERGGDWTLQRLIREVTPVRELAIPAAARTEAASTVTVLQQVRIDSLDIAILKGGGPEVFAWANENGFALPGDTEAVLDGYGQRSPYFMAARFDAADAVSRGLESGDGIPIHLTIPVDRPWVPLHILAAAKPSSEVVAADVFLLTDQRPELLTGRGTTLSLSTPASSRLLDDLRSDKGMTWVPEAGWLSHVEIDVPARDLGYDLAIGVDGRDPLPADTGLQPEVARTTLSPPQALPNAAASSDDVLPLWLVVGGPMAIAATLLAVGAVVVVSRRPTPA